ncbi:ABC transporter substrate-binding protein [candidate division WWE3 bacterium]|jgi:peptide/nickel transport system substrate-binding protein|uniref:ABC transporter substrate-binding protein n=1 Tax=candidate division WWE3 bacterium TaxID=2053526 RepID=A0A3A4ZI43_UNCKA|nr:MAG: ABC transporter substrate-binding protein [candidate division WWE3 bacterium]
MNIFQKIVFIFTSFLLSIAPVSSFTEGVVGQPESFFPGKAVSNTDRTISHMLFRSLFKYDIYGSLIPDLAESWSVSEDGLVYTVKLKDNQYWTNGRKITSDDLIYTSFNIEDLAGVATDKVDDLTVRYVLPNKYAPFLSLLTIGVMPRNSIEDDNSLMPISSGDFRVVRVEKDGVVIKQVVLRTTSNDYKIKKIVFRYYSKDEELATAAKLGEIDGFLSESTYDLESFINHRFPTQGIYYSLYFNLNNEKLQDADLRKKLEKVLHMRDLVYDKGIEVQGPISRSVFTDEELKFNKYDPEFKEDLTGTQVQITVPDVSEHREFADRIKDTWEDKLKVNVEINEVAPDQMLSSVIEPRNFEILFYGQETGRDPDRYVNWHSTQKEHPGLNITGFENVRADRALEEGRNELENDKRVVHYNEFQKAIIENSPAIFLYHPYTNYYVSKYISGIGEKYTFTYADRFLDFFNWERIHTN